MAGTVREFDRMGVAALRLEDQAIPNRCGHYDGKALVPPATMVARIHAALDARTDPRLVIIARTDARADEGLDAALDRARSYAEAGADMLFIEAPQSEQEVAAIADCGLAARDQHVRRVQVSAAECGAGGRLGYAVMIVPSDLQRAAIFAMQRAADALLRDGSTASLVDGMVSIAERDRLVGLDADLERDNGYAAGRTAV